MTAVRIRTTITSVATAAATGAVVLAVAAPAHGHVADRPTAGATTAATSAGVGGPHWYLTEVYSGHRAAMGGIAPSGETLVLVSPSGDTRTFLSRAVIPKTGRGAFKLRDWSVDGSTALLTTGHGRHTSALRVDLATGRVQAMRLPDDPLSVLLAPDGSGIVESSFEDPSRPGFQLEKVDWSGTAVMLGVEVSGSFIAGPDNTVIVGGTSYRQHLLRTVSLANGAVLDRVRTAITCTPIRWWDSDRLLARCGGQLHLVDPHTGAETPLTSRKGVHDYGHLDARRIGSGLYVQIAGACGTSFVDHQAADGSLHPMDVPGVVGNVRMVDGIGNDLVLDHEADCEEGAPVYELTRFDPVTQDERPILVLPHGQEFGRLLVHGEVDATLD